MWLHVEIGQNCPLRHKLVTEEKRNSTENIAIILTDNLEYSHNAV